MKIYWRAVSLLFALALLEFLFSDSQHASADGSRALVSMSECSLIDFCPHASICYKHSFSLPDAPEICYVLREKASNSVSYRKVLPNEDGSSL